MTYCERIDNPQYRIDLAQLTKILGDSNAAVAALELNNGFNLNKAPNGNASYLYQSLYDNISEKYPDLSESQKIEKVIKLKLQTYSEEFKNWFGDWQTANNFVTDLDSSRVEFEITSNENEHEGNQTLKIYLKGQKNKGHFELVKDREFGQYSVHFKTDKTKLQPGDTKVCNAYNTRGDCVPALPAGPICSPSYSLLSSSFWSSVTIESQKLPIKYEKSCN